MLRLLRRAKQQAETGRIVNLMSADVNQLMMFFYPFANQLVSGPAMLIAALVLLWFQIKCVLQFPRSSARGAEAGTLALDLGRGAWAGAWACCGAADQVSEMLDRPSRPPSS